MDWTSIRFALLLLIAFGVSSCECVNRLRVCTTTTPNSSLEVTDSECSRGAWLPEQLQVDCVCASGVWVLSENYCSEDFIVVSGPNDNAAADLSCFAIPSSLRRLVSLSPPTSEYKHFVYASNGKDIRELNTPYHSLPKNDTSPVVILRLNPSSDMFVAFRDSSTPDSGWQKCVSKPKRSGNYIQVLKSDQPVSYFKSVGEDGCEGMRDSEIPYTNTNNTVWEIEITNGGAWSPTVPQFSRCDCPTPSGMERPVRPPKMNTPHDDPSARPVHWVHNTDADYDNTPNDITDLFSPYTDPLVQKERLADNSRTTASMLSHLKNYILQGTPPPSLTLPTFQYVRLGRKVLEKSCPELPSHVLGNLVGLFRILVADMLSRFPDEYPNNLDVNTHSRILQSMQACINSLQPVKFFWKQEPPTCVRSIVATEVNGTSKPVPKIPDPVRFKRGVSDIVLEVAWKTMLAAHYACSSFFEAHPDDLSFMYVKAQEFLTIPYVLFRWENPANYLTDAYKLLNPSLSASDLAEQVDACVATAFISSPYKTWLTRPHSSTEFLRRSIMDRSMGRMTKSGGSSGKTVFQGTGYCVHKFDDPSRWTAVNPEIQAVC